MKKLTKKKFDLLLSNELIVGDTISLKGIKYKIVERAYSSRPTQREYEVGLSSLKTNEYRKMSMYAIDAELVERDFSYSLRFYTRFYQLVLRKYLDEIRRSEVSETTPVDMEHTSNVLTSLQFLLINENA